jgi:hypothetical protein
MFGFKKKIEKIKKPKTTTLEKYHIHFKTVDGEMHEFTRLCAANPNAIVCSIPDYYMIDKKYLEDDEDVKYPVNNIISIQFELVDTIENVIELNAEYGLSLKQLWYPKEEIKIFEE